jgi:cyclin D2
MYRQLSVQHSTMDSNNKENINSNTTLMMTTSSDEGYLSCTEIFCEASLEEDEVMKPLAQSYHHQRSLPKVLQVRAQVDRTLTADDRVLINMIRNEPRYLPANPDYFRYVQADIKPHMRKIVSDWMLEVCQELCCQPEVFCLAMSLMDRFLARCRILKSQLQLLGAVCLFLASKFKETTPIPSEKLVMYTDFSVSLEEIREWELIVLHRLKWDLCSSTPLDYLDHLLPRLLHPGQSAAAGVDRVKLRRQTETIIALTATHYLFSYVRPSVIAAAAIAVSLRCLLPPRFTADSARHFLTSLQVFAQAEAADLEATASAMVQTLPAYLTSPPAPCVDPLTRLHEETVAAAVTAAVASTAVTKPFVGAEGMDKSNVKPGSSSQSISSVSGPTSPQFSSPGLVMDTFRGQTSVLVKSC